MTSSLGARRTAFLLARLLSQYTKVTIAISTCGLSGATSCTTGPLEAKIAHMAQTVSHSIEYAHPGSFPSRGQTSLLCRVLAALQHGYTTSVTAAKRRLKRDDKHTQMPRRVPPKLQTRKAQKRKLQKRKLHLITLDLHLITLNLH